MITIGILGGTGYTGVELLRLLARHPRAKLAVITSRGEGGGMYTGNVYPGASTWTRTDF